MAGIMLRKMPMNSLATSKMGSQVKSLRLRHSLSVSVHDAAAIRMYTRSRTTFCISMGTPRMWNVGPVQAPEIKVLAMTQASSRKLTPPSIPSFSPLPGVAPGWVGRPSLLYSTVSTIK